VAEVVESLVDWLSCSASSDSASTNLEALGYLWVGSEEKRGNKRRPWNIHGYTGESAGRAHVASGPAGTIAVLSGALANERFHTAIGASENVSRIDLAVTTRHDDGEPELAKHAADCYDAWKQTQRNPPKDLLIDGRGEGDTFYVGSRSSDYFLRIYNKHLESRDRQYHHCWRVELECKGGVSTSLAHLVPLGSHRPDWIAGRLRNHLLTHGLAPWWDDCGPALSNETFHRRADAESRLRWLDEQVMPGVRWLMDNGWTPELSKVLGADVIRQLHGYVGGGP